MDVYFKKEISYSFEGKNFTFDVGNTLFSTFDVDHGTDVLLRSIDIKKPKTILDIGCGYGPIGIILAKKYVHSDVTLIDRDLLAVRYARHNAIKNGAPNVTVIGSVGMEQLAEQKFDLIVSNVPAKIGDEAIVEEFLLEPFSRLSVGGELWIVVVNGLNRLIPSAGRKHKIPLREVRKRNGHTVYTVKRIS